MVSFVSEEARKGRKGEDMKVQKEGIKSEFASGSGD